MLVFNIFVNIIKGTSRPILLHPPVPFLLIFNPLTARTIITMPKRIVLPGHFDAFPQLFPHLPIHASVNAAFNGIYDLIPLFQDCFTINTRRKI